LFFIKSKIGLWKNEQKLVFVRDKTGKKFKICEKRTKNGKKTNQKLLLLLLFINLQFGEILYDFCKKINQTLIMFFLEICEKKKEKLRKLRFFLNGQMGNPNKNQGKPNKKSAKSKQKQLISEIQNLKERNPN
jgi:hypothetical protein